MKPRLQLFGYTATTPTFKNRWGKIFVPHKVYAGGDFNLTCLFETWRRLGFLPLFGNYVAYQDGIEWEGVSSNFGITPPNNKPPEFEVKWENAIEDEGIISIECYYREINFSKPNKWILLSNARVDDEFL